MNRQLRAGPTSLERLDTAIDRLLQKHGFSRVEGDRPAFPAGLSALLLTEDPQRNLEVLDACVILPEALKPLADRISRWVAGPDFAAPLMQQYGVARAPAVVFLRDGLFVGSLNGIRDWNEYRDEVNRLLNSPVQVALVKKTIAIPVRIAAAPGACA